MSADKQLETSYNKGVSDQQKGTFHPPSSDSLKAALDTAVSFTTVDQRDSAYRAGHSDGGRNNKT